MPGGGSEIRYAQPSRRIHRVVFVRGAGYRSVCGGPVVEVDPRDVYDLRVGRRVWLARPEDRCRSCERVVRDVG